MSSTRIVLWTMAVMLGGFGCVRYEAPCAVGEPQTLTSIYTAYSSTFRMSRLSEERVLVIQAKGSSQVQLNGRITPTEDIVVDAMIFNRHGMVSAQHQVIPGIPRSDLQFDPLQDRVWLGDALAVLSTQVDVMMDSQGVSHDSRQLQLRIYDERGLRSGPTPIAACTDCIMPATIRGAGDEALVVFRQEADGQEFLQTSWAAVGSDGSVRATGILGNLAADETIDSARFTASQREDAIFIPTTRNRAWLADSRFRRLTAPLTAQRDDQWDWDLADTRIARAWVASPNTTRDVLTAQVGFDGKELLSEDRISAGGSVAAMATAAESIGAILVRDEMGWFVVRGSDGAKLGGDIPFEFHPFAAVLVPQGASSFLLYSVEHLDAGEYVLRSRTMECHL